jgi:hypothetical protein
MSSLTNLLADEPHEYDDMCHRIVHIQARHDDKLPLRVAKLQWASDKVTKQVCLVT